MATDQHRLRDGIRHDSEARRKAQRHGRQKGITITIAAAELRRAGIDPDGPVPEYRVFPGKKADGGVQLRLYRD
jgi:hypothetical protein